MTWALAEACQLFAVSYAVRASLKCLKRLSVCTVRAEESEGSGGTSVAALQEALMFWVIYGVYMVFEQHVECVVRWLPGYYYAKAAFIIVVAFPRLQITKFVFHKGVVPTLEECNRLVDSGGGAPSVQTVVFHAPLVLLSLALPFLGPEVRDKEQEQENNVAGAETIPGGEDEEEEKEKEKEEEEEEEEGMGEAERAWEEEDEAEDWVEKDDGKMEVETPWVSTPPLPPPISPLPSPRSPNSADGLLSPSKSLSPGFTRLSDSLKGRIKESSRRLSSLAAIINRLGSPKSPPKGVVDSTAGRTRRYLSPPWRSGGSGKVSPDPSFASNALPRPPTRAQFAGSLPSSPVSTLDRAVTSVRSMFSLDVHSPPANSIRRRQSLMGHPSPPLQAPLPTPRAAPSTTLLPPLEEALRRGNVSSRRGHGGNR